MNINDVRPGSSFTIGIEVRVSSESPMLCRCLECDQLWQPEILADKVSEDFYVCPNGCNAGSPLIDPRILFQRTPRQLRRGKLKKVALA